MEPQQNIQPVIENDIQQESTQFMTKVFGWMCAGLAMTGVTAYYVSVSPALAHFFIGQQATFYALLIIELLAVIFLTRGVGHMSARQAGGVFLLYSLLNGLTFSVIFLIYDISSIGRVFAITAGTFGAMALYGYVTKRDLTTVGNLAFFGLIGLVIASITNLFIQSTRADLILAYIGVAIFVALTAYDVQKIKNMNIIGNAGTDQDKKESIMGALTLYLDFINLFLKLLRILGKRRS